MGVEWAFLADKVFPALTKGLAMSVALIVPSALIGFVFGMALGILRVFAPRWARFLGDAYTAVVRGVPLIVQLMVLYYGLLPLLGVSADLYRWFDGLQASVSPHSEMLAWVLGAVGSHLEAYLAAVAGFIMCTGAYQSEYMRGALLSIRQGQIRAAYALGMSRFQTVLWIIAPQAARRALPGCGNEIIYMIKYSSLAYLITFREIMAEATSLVSTYFRPTEVYLVAGLCYLALVSVATWILARLEHHFSIPGFGRPKQ